MAIKRALLSVYDKTGLVEFAKVLHQKGIELISTGGTAKALKDVGIPVIELGDYTGFPEMLGGRVKTLHPKIHGGLLYVRGNSEHEKTVAEHGIGPIDLVVSNLYPFEQVVAKGAADGEIIENIDIGGPSMIRSGSKNHASVTVVVDPADYSAIAEEIKKSGSVSLEKRRDLAGKAFARTAAYDAAIAAYFAEHVGLTKSHMEAASEGLSIDAPLVQQLRYGENPHQKAALYGKFNEYYSQLHGKELSYNNILDLTAAAELIHEFNPPAGGDEPTVAILKHNNPCGVGQAMSLKEAWDKAFATDTQAPFGGIIASNREIDVATAEAIKELFCEVIIAPDFAHDALTVLKEKKNLRLIKILKDPTEGSLQRVRSVGPDTYVAQDADVHVLKESDLKVVTKRQPTKEEMKALLFAWRVAKHVKSNAIVYAAPDRTLGVGAGQMSRIDSTKLAIWKAKEAGLSLQGSALASDAFFPFPDGLIAAAEAGATAIIQPGGAMKDADVIAAADERNISMVFTGVRHFRH
ncbi:bifunctional phosphoribosylaminoimidazolecarboxamide formyltransferase/IMP cyclohydrolase [Candidatus Kaiserbacteria bacterium]|nr:bifunctional phosphoribosylaminoimidazolecarboxamide formyltransferase/IMP cyclohydrolase [Candidatus Kaiserbacteria bacterium]